MPRHRSNNNTPKPLDSKYPKTVSQCLNDTLAESLLDGEKRIDSTIVSSNKLANRFILHKYGIRSSQRRRYRNLFSQIRQKCRVLFRQYLEEGRIDVVNESKKQTFWIYKFDDIRGNLILGFTRIPLQSEHDEHIAGS